MCYHLDKANTQGSSKSSRLFLFKSADKNKYASMNKSFDLIKRTQNVGLRSTYEQETTLTKHENFPKRRSTKRKLENDSSYSPTSKLKQ
jgi:hypothetical protein